MTREEAQSCIKTIELLRRLAYSIHGVMDVIDAKNCEKIIEALSREPSEDVRCSETPKSSERTAETTQIDHAADVSKKVERTGKPSQDVSDSDLISRKAAIDALARMMPRSCTPDGSHPADEEIFRAQEVFADCIEALEILPSAQSEPTQEIQDILDYLDTVLHPIVSPEHWDVYSKLHDMVSGLPSAQLDGIPLEWIDKHLEWLDNCDNDFAQLAKVSIKAMVELWKKDRI